MQRHPETSGTSARATGADGAARVTLRRPESGEFAARLAHNLGHLRKWLRHQGISCFRAYDRDVPQFPFSIDVFGAHAILYEFDGVGHPPPQVAEQRLADALDVLCATAEIPPRHVHVKTRRRKEGLRQYQKLDARKSSIVVQEGGHRFELNLSDYLDPGIFLDHRTTRAMLQEEARERRFLNLFCYTSSATVYAAAGGARSTTSVDLSRTYLEWSRRNFDLNHIRGDRHRLVQADCRDYLRRCREQFDLVFVDPPTFSNSKKVGHHFDVHKGHVDLLQRVGRCLAPGGIVYFSTNFSRFRIDTESLREFEIRNITRATIPKDFERNAKAHQCWKLRRKADSGESERRREGETET